MARERQLKVKITGDERDLARAFGRSESTMSKWGRTFSTVGKAAALGLAGVGIAAVKFGRDFVEAAEESIKIGKQTAAVIKSTGGAAGVTAGQVSALAEKLSLKAGIDDELIQSGQNVLLTFTKIRNEVGKGNDIFNQASAIALDMSVALGTDLQSSITQVGKALNDPIAGLTSLTRAGVQFSDQQKEQIRTLVESGDVLGAQKVILAELSTQFAGSAEAQATASGKLSVAWGNLQEVLGKKLLPLVEAFTVWLTETGIPALEKMANFVDRNSTAFTALAIVVGGALTAAFAAWAVSVIIATGPILAIGAAVALVAALVVIHFDTIKGAFMGAFEWLKRNWPLVLGILTGPVGLAVLAITRHWDTIKRGAKAVIDAVAGFFTGLPGRIAGALGRIPNLFSTAMSAAWRHVTDFVGRIVEAIKSIPGKIAGLGGRIRDAIVGGIGKIDLSPGFDIPGVPFMAEGGIVRRPTLAMIGESGPEAVVPLNRMGGPAIHVHLEGAILTSERDAVAWVSRAVSMGLHQGRINKRGTIL